MKLQSKGIASFALIVCASVLAAFLARILSLYVFGVLFNLWNLTPETYAFAPVWAQRLASVSGDAANVSFLVFLVLPLFLYSSQNAPFRRRDLLYVCAGALMSIFFVGTFLLSGSVRMPKYRTFPSLGAGFVDILIDFFFTAACAFLCRCAPGKAFSKNAAVRLILSAVLQTVCLVAGKNSFSPVLAANACLSGILLFALYERTGSVLPEILLVFSFRIFTRFGFGYPDLGGAYPVSEPMLTGAAGGASHSLLLLVCLTAACAAVGYRLIRRRRRRSLKGEKHVL